MRNLLVLFLFLCLCIFIGCLGVGGSGGSLGGSGGPDSSAMLAGRVYFADRQLYGGIPVTVIDLIGQTISTTLTDSAGYFAFPQLAAGIYDLVAQTGESEVIFAKALQVDGVTTQLVSEVSLLGIRDVIIDEIGSDSFHIKFRSNRACRASIEYGPLGGFQLIKTIGQAGATTHETTITGLKPLTDYEISLYLTGDDGQDFVMRGLFVGTTGAAGPQNLALAINEGAYETRSQNVTLYLNADNATQMRISESYDMSDASWVSYSQIYSYTLSSISAGTKRIYVQFRDANGVTTPVQSDGILMTYSGYVGIWINDGSALTNNTEAVVRIIFPSATHMQLSNNPIFLNSFWEVYAGSKKWKFSSGDGMKTIYCRFKGGQADPYEVFTASILLDTTPPEVTMHINNKATVTATSSVTLSFSFSVAPTQMKLANTEAPASSAAWIPFKDGVAWTLPTGDGEKEVFGIFKDGAENEYGPVSAKIELDTVAPIGNTIALQLTEDSSSDVATFALLADLPVFLHFDVTDNTTYQAHYAITAATTTPPVSFSTVGVPFTPVPLGESQLPVGTYKIWTRFTDLAGNAGFFQSTNVKIDGPQIIVSPTSASLSSGREQQFAATIKNIEMQEVGSIRWRVVDGSGTIDANGLYTAPAPVYFAAPATVRADSTLIPTLYSHVTVDLATSVEMLFKQRNGQYTYDATEDQVPPGESVTTVIKTLHSTLGYEISKQPAAGSVSLSPAVTSDFGMISTLTFTAPSVVPTINPVIIGVRSLENPTGAVGTLSFLVSAGANLVVSPTSGEAQRNHPQVVSATVTGTASTTMSWFISPEGMGSFDPENPAVYVATTTSPDHAVTFYASTPDRIRQASVTASIAGTSKKSNITVYPPINFEIDPTATSSMPITAPMTFKIQGFDYLLGNATEAVTWEFKNTSRTDFMPADGKTYIDRGSLTVVDAVTAEFRRPTALPSLSDPTALDSVTIRATSVADPTASATAITTIAPKVVVEIFDTVEKVASISHTATVAEVGKIQFFAGVTPSVIGNTSVSWTVNGTTGSDQYGSIDSNGLYTAPDLVVINEVTVRAASNYDPTAFAEVKVTLSDFWLPKRTNMFDSITGEVMPVNSLLINPYTASGSPFTVYAGTSGYGVWIATFSDLPGDPNGGYWQGVPEISVPNKSSTGKYNIGHLVISPEQRVYAGTTDGIWYIPTAGNAERVTGDVASNNLPNENFLKLAFDKKNPQYLFATTPRGVYRITLSAAQTCSGWLKVLNTTDLYKNSDIESRTDSTASPPVTVDAYTNTYNLNPINGTIQTIAYDDYNDRLYAGGEGGVFLFMNDTTIPNLVQRTASAFQANPPSVSTAMTTFFVLSGNQPRRANPDLAFPPLDLALDEVNRSTLWAATVGGVYRSIDNGMTWTGSPFSTGSGINSRAIIVDPTNTINVLAGSEDGLYRTTDAGTGWTRIRSGLGNHKTITSLIQAAGLAGARRKVWVGTAGGVFMGKQSLDLE